MADKRLVLYLMHQSSQSILQAFYKNLIKSALILLHFEYDMWLNVSTIQLLGIFFYERNIIALRTNMILVIELQKDKLVKYMYAFFAKCD